MPQIEKAGDRFAKIEHRLDVLEAHEHHNLLLDIKHKVQTIMADAASVLAKVTANTDALRSIQLAATALEEGQATIADQIAAAVDDQSAVVSGIAAAIPAGTSLAKK